MPSAGQIAIKQVDGLSSQLGGANISGFFNTDVSASTLAVGVNNSTDVTILAPTGGDIYVVRSLLGAHQGGASGDRDLAVRWTDPATDIPIVTRIEMFSGRIVELLLKPLVIESGQTLSLIGQNSDITVLASYQTITDTNFKNARVIADSDTTETTVFTSGSNGSVIESILASRSISPSPGVVTIEAQLDSGSSTYYNLLRSQLPGGFGVDVVPVEVIQNPLFIPANKTVRSIITTDGSGREAYISVSYIDL